MLRMLADVKSFQVGPQLSSPRCSEIKRFVSRFIHCSKELSASEAYKDGLKVNFYI